MRDPETSLLSLSSEFWIWTEVMMMLYAFVCVCVCVRRSVRGDTQEEHLSLATGHYINEAHMEAG